MAKVLVALLRFSAKQQREILQKVDEQVNQVGVLSWLFSDSFVLWWKIVGWVSFIFLTVLKKE